MRLTIYPSEVRGSIEAPASKSSMQRALAAALIRKGTTVILNPGISNDDLAARESIVRLGAKIRELGVNIREQGLESREQGAGSSPLIAVESNGIEPVSDIIDCGESGLGIRMFTPLVALSDRKLTVTGSGSLRTRPMDFFDEIFPTLGIQIHSAGGKLPMVIKGPLQPKDITVDGSLSSQFLTGLLMAYAAAGAKDVTISVRDLKSKPYVDLTLNVLESFGWEVVNRDHQHFYFPGNYRHQEGELQYRVEGDWSGAAFLLVAGAIAGDLRVTGLDPGSTQADKAVLQALQDAGATLDVRKDVIRVSRGALQSFEFDATECPDLFPPLVALAAVCNGVSRISGVERLTHKESNRALTLQQEFGKLGVLIELQEGVMLIHGVRNLTAADTHAHHDHRIAMACAVAALRAEGPVHIDNAEAVGKSYPDFFEDLRQIAGTSVVHEVAG